MEMFELICLIVGLIAQITTIISFSFNMYDRFHK